MRSETPKLRLRILSGCFILLALLLVLRLYFVQVVHSEEFREDAMGQYVSSDSDTDERGSIFFTSKTGALVAAAVMQTGWRVAISPKDLKDAKSVFEKLNSIAPLDRERFFTSAEKTSDPYEEVAFRIDDAAAKAIRALRLDGVILVQDQWRLYPAHDLASQVIGFVGYKGDSKTGVYGLEKHYNQTLTQHSAGAMVNPFAEIFANAQALFSDDPAAHEGSVITTIEPNAQAKLEATLETVMKEYSPKMAGGIVMDPHTGEIIAMGVRPGYDPNTYNTVSDPQVFSNPLVEGRYEMGSIMKPLTMVAGIDAGAVTPETTYNDTGCITKSAKKVCNFDFKARGVVPMQEVLNQSLNTGVSFVVDKMGTDSFAQYVKAFGLGEKTNIDLPDEVTGDITVMDGGSAIDYASASFGQSIAVSPIEMTRALAVLANDGILPRPHVGKGIKYSNGLIRAIKPSLGTQVLQPKSVETVTDMLVKVFDTALLKGELKQEHYSIAAKTGTAQLAIPGGGGYYSDRFLHSFFGYFPAHEPKYIVFLFTVEPHGAEFASATLARPFMDIAKYLINYYQIPPDR